MTGKAKVRPSDGKAVGRAKAEQDDEVMIYLLMPSPPFVARLTLCVAIATATAVAKIRIEQFWAIPLAGKVVAPPCVMAMPLSYSIRHDNTGFLGFVHSCGSRNTTPVQPLLIIAVASPSLTATRSGIVR